MPNSWRDLYVRSSVHAHRFSVVAKEEALEEGYGCISYKSSGASGKQKQTTE